MGAELPEVLVLPAVTITLHDVLVSTVTGILVAHKAVAEIRARRRERQLEREVVNVVIVKEGTTGLM